MDDLLSMVRSYSDRIRDGRSIEEISVHLEDEVEELAIEVTGVMPGEDGVAGEAVDVMLCALDLIFKARPDWTNQDIFAYAEKKCQKWYDKNSR